ncbi:hypothetical protein BLX24_15090 [Arsenicibacter rosenii]|uniref:Uncharacterized protein n=1 Tax=Arsenicibacter rosenii TaxID=1750698 RepID=A0A1S2VHT3_9BACT|nr:hypothetical protein BLX24_15090 [Arsenicibacter rosenii]
MVADKARCHVATGFISYLVNEILYPGWHNYFYWLVGLSLAVRALEILFPWRKDQPAFLKNFRVDLFFNFSCFR